jgi:hypothetical protein
MIRAVGPQDADVLWAILEPVIRGGETYALPQDMTRQDALSYWFSPGHHVFVAEVDGEILGTYYLRANQQGGGAHVANCAYMTHPTATGKGRSQRDVLAFTRICQDARFPGDAV